jgi:hypothetical protein
MNSPSLLRGAKAAIVVGLAGLSLAVAAADPGAKKPERRLPPTGSQTSDIPAGVDTGSPATTNAMPLGTPIPPTLSADRADQNKRSAAARAAARPASSALGPRIDMAPAEPTVVGATPPPAGATTGAAPTRAEVLKATTPPRKPKASRQKAASGV